LSRITRREVLAAGAPLAVTQQNSTSPQQEQGVTPSEVETLDRVLGHTHTPEERAQMARGLTQTRRELKALRPNKQGDRLQPSFRFVPGISSAPPLSRRPPIRTTKPDTDHLENDPEALAFASVTQLGELLRTRRISSAKLTEIYLERIYRYGPRLQCNVTVTAELARAQAAQADREIAAGHYRGPLHGLPYGLKDLFHTRGIRTTYGAKGLEEQIIDEDATVVERLREAGAVLLAKTTLGELAMGDVWFGGVTRNPWNPAQGSSGSSAGSASGTAAGLFAFSIGTETLGSIVSPCIRNGATGLRPTYGRVSRHGAMALSWTMDKVGPICRYVEDCAIVLHAIHGPDGRDFTALDTPFSWTPSGDIRRLRIGIDTKAFEAAERNTRTGSIYKAARESLTKLGIKLRPIELPAFTSAWQHLAGTIIDVEGASAFQRLAETGGLAKLVQQSDSSWPNTFRVGACIPAVDYLQAMRLRTALQAEMERLWKEIDLFVSTAGAVPNIYYGNLCGYPTLVTRCGMSDGRPLSIEFSGAAGREADICRVGLAYEKANKWAAERPPLASLPQVPPPVNNR
jgi:Asp-tRNA(Asn)/Glu-tRNA(Gln) amidotransferase A subunit family amidase